MELPYQVLTVISIVSEGDKEHIVATTVLPQDAILVAETWPRSRVVFRGQTIWRLGEKTGDMAPYNKRIWVLCGNKEEEESNG